MKSLNRIYLALAIIVALVISGQIVRWSLLFGTGLEIHLSLLIFFVPSLVLVFCSYLARSSKKRPDYLSAFLLSLIAFGIWGFFSVGVEAEGSLAQSLKDVRDPSRYEDVLTKKWGDLANLVDQFPRQIPASATNVHFFFHPGFLMDGSEIQLRCALPPDEIADQYNHFSKLASLFFGGDAPGTNGSVLKVPNVEFYTADPPSNEFPNDYVIMVLDPIVDQHASDSDHGSSHGVAISKQRNEIVYWTETW